MTCGTCGRTWDATQTPTPASRCPFEYEHGEDITLRAYVDTGSIDCEHMRLRAAVVTAGTDGTATRVLTSMGYPAALITTPFSEVEDAGRQEMRAFISGIASTEYVYGDPRQMSGRNELVKTIRAFADGHGIPWTDAPAWDDAGDEAYERRLASSYGNGLLAVIQYVQRLNLWSWAIMGSHSTPLAYGSCPSAEEAMRDVAEWESDHDDTPQA
jgi:hypothetical protein